MYKNLVIKFTINPYRKYRHTSINAELSEYWQKQYTDMFKGW